MVVAALAMLVANRLLPEELPQRGDWEERVFWCAWLLAFAACRLAQRAACAQGRIAPAWREQCWAIAVLGGAAVLLNWVTTRPPAEDDCGGLLAGGGVGPGPADDRGTRRVCRAPSAPW